MARAKRESYGSVQPEVGREPYYSVEVVRRRGDATDEDKLSGAGVLFMAAKERSLASGVCGITTVDPLRRLSKDKIIQESPTGTGIVNLHSVRGKSMN